MVDKKSALRTNQVGMESHVGVPSNMLHSDRSNTNKTYKHSRTRTHTCQTQAWYKRVQSAERQGTISREGCIRQSWPYALYK